MTHTCQRCKTPVPFVDLRSHSCPILPGRSEWVRRAAAATLPAKVTR
jgi:hypothetical protein